MEYFPSEISEGMQHLSESVYNELCLIVGTSEQVAIRREIANFEEMVLSPLGIINEINGNHMMLSGSRREGFKLRGSDVDIMMWSNSFRVVTDLSQSEYYDLSESVLLLSDSSESPPGFTLLKLFQIPEFDMDVVMDMEVGMNIYRSLVVRIKDSFYISCSGMKDIVLTMVSSISNSINGMFPTAHGPCATFFAEGLGCDFAVCFVCDFWPSYATSWKNRCHSWPAPEIVDEIVRVGCHFVAIGHPFGLHENMEWRISFSQAEQKCVYAMDHCQFLTYGLLKLFLKEVINQQCEEIEELLCSYHIKTTVLWAIQQNMLSHWCPQNLLAGFWVCFKLLLKWVYEGVCPNFFIPQNNLFLSKIYGSAQERLFLQLHELYKKGLTCLLQCSSIRSCITNVLYNPRLTIRMDESDISSEVVNDEELFNAALMSEICFGGEIEFVKVINTLEEVICSPLTQYQVVHLGMLTVTCLQKIAAILLHKSYNAPRYNKKMYFTNRLSGQMLKLAAKFGCVTDMLYLAMFYYKTSDYRTAASVLEKTKAKLSRPYLMYNGNVDREKYTEAVGGQSWSTKRRKALACDIRLTNSSIYIDELGPVQHFAQQNWKSELGIPVFVFLHFLEFLCYRHIDRRLSQAALDELQVLVQYGQKPYVLETNRDISLQILEICQRMSRNFEDTPNTRAIH